jgi:hypothetical protein
VPPSSHTQSLLVVKKVEEVEISKRCYLMADKIKDFRAQVKSRVARTSRTAVPLNARMLVEDTRDGTEVVYDQS